MESPEPVAVYRPTRSKPSRQSKPKATVLTGREKEALKVMEATRKQIDRLILGRDQVGAEELVKWGQAKGWCSA